MEALGSRDLPGCHAGPCQQCSRLQLLPRPAQRAQQEARNWLKEFMSFQSRSLIASMADMLRCAVVQVDGRTYRAIHTPSSGARQQRQQRQHYSETEEVDNAEWGDAGPHSRGGSGRGGAAGLDDGDGAAEEKTAVEIAEEGGVFVARMQLDAEASGRESSAVVVRGPSRGAVARACTQLELLISQQLSARGPRSLDYNFFLCLPLANPDTVARIAAFRDAVLAEPGTAAAGLDPSVFMPPQHLHLTIAMLKLYSDERRELARRTLRELAPRVRELLGSSGCLEVQLRGLEYMNDDPSQIHVMYLGVQDAPGCPGGLQRLQQLCATVVEAFAGAGLLLPQDERAVKLHATVINTRKRAVGSSGSGGGARQANQGQQGGQWEQRQPFDGRDLLERHADADLGSVRLPAVHLSKRGQYDSQTGFYLCVDSLAL